MHKIVGLFAATLTTLATALAGVGSGMPATVASATAAVSAPDERPNIVLFLTDDMRADDLAYAPYIRRFFAQGVQFRNSFSNNPMCCPARASILTGRYSHNHHVLDVKPPWGFGSFDDRYTVATALQGAGYQTALVGKYMNLYGEQRSKVTGKDSGHYVPAGWTQWFGTLDDNHFGVPGGTYHYFDTTWNANGDIVRNRGKYSTDLIVDKSRQLVAEFAKDPDPFFLHISTVAPHFGSPHEADDPKLLKHFTPARPRWVRGRFDAMLPKSPGVPSFTRSPEADVRDKTWPIRSLPEVGHAAQAAVRELARQRAETIYVIDRQFKKLIERLRATDELDSTVVIFTSDNGHFLGEHRKLTGKLLPYEPSFRVPLLVRAPGGRQGGRVFPVTTVDLGVTLLDLGRAEGRLPYPTDGRSFAPEIYGGDAAYDVPVFYEAVVPAMNADRHGLSGIGVRTSRWKFVLYNNGRAELYDLVKDPHELTNLVWTHGAPKVVGALTKVVNGLRRCKADKCRVRLPKKFRATVGQAKHDLRVQEAAAWFKPPAD